MSPIASRPTLQAPLTGQALRRSVADHEVGEWTAWAQALRVAGYRVDAAGLADQLLTHGCARVRDAFGQEVMVQVKVPARATAANAARLDADALDVSARSFRIAS